MFTQQRQAVVMAGEQRQHLRLVVESHGEGALQVGVQRLDLRRQPRLRLALGPQQLVAEFGQPRGLALVPDDQRMAEFRSPSA